MTNNQELATLMKMWVLDHMTTGFSSSVSNTCLESNLSCGCSKCDKLSEHRSNVNFWWKWINMLTFTICYSKSMEDPFS